MELVVTTDPDQKIRETERTRGGRGGDAGIQLQTEREQITSHQEQIPPGVNT